MKFLFLSCFIIVALSIIVNVFVSAAGKEQQQQQQQHPTISQPPIHISLSGLRPYLSSEQLNLHYNGHLSAYVSGIKNYFESPDSEEEVVHFFRAYQNQKRAAEVAFVQNSAAKKSGETKISSTSTDQEKQCQATLLNQSFVTYLAQNAKPGSKVKNFAGQIYNHALFFSMMTQEPIQLPDYVTAYQKTSRFSTDLLEQFGSVENFLNEFKKVGMSHFGSGWVWCVALKTTKKKQQQQKNEPNNKLFFKIMDTHDGETIHSKIDQLLLQKNSDDDDDIIIENAIPLFVVDMWEHSYYVDYRNKKAMYLDAIMKVFDYSRVERRYIEFADEIRGTLLTEKERGTRMIPTPISETDAYPYFL